MSAAAAHTRTALAPGFAAWVLDLCRILCGAGPPGIAGRHPAIAPLVPALLIRLQRLSRRFQRLAERFAAGTLRPPRRRTEPRRDTPRERPADPLPRADAWLIRRLMHPELDAARRALVVHTNALLEQLATPAWQALLAAEPARAGRLLRPLLRMTRGEAELPAALRLPKPRREPRPAKTPSRAQRSGPRPAAGESPGSPTAADPPGTDAAPAPRQPSPQGWRLVPVIRVVWPTPGVVRFRIGRRIPQT